MIKVESNLDYLVKDVGELAHYTISNKLDPYLIPNRKPFVFIKPIHDRQDYKCIRKLWGIIFKILRWRIISFKSP